MFDFDLKKIKKMHDGLKDLRIANIMITALKNLDYETYLKTSADGNPMADIVDPKDAMPEEIFDVIKEGLIDCASLVGWETSMGLFKDILGKTTDDSDDDFDISEMAKKFKGFSKFNVSDSNKTEPDDDVDMEHVKLTGNPAIDTEIIFNMIKNKKE